MESRETLLFRILDYLQKLRDFEEGFQDILDKTQVGYDLHKRALVDMTLVNYVLELLEKLYIDSEKWIHFWVYDLDFGKKWEPGTITSLGGKDIKLQTKQDLANFLEQKLIYKSKTSLQEIDKRLNSKVQ